MKLFCSFFCLTLLLYSCTFYRYGLPYKVKTETYVFENNYQIEIDSSELIGIKFGQSIQQFDDNGVHIANIFQSDSLNVFELAKKSNSFINDLDFNIKKKSIQIDSICFLIVYMDSTEIDSSYNVLDSRRVYVNPSNYLEFMNENEPDFYQEMYLIDGLIIYSKGFNYVFNNYILWY